MTPTTVTINSRQYRVVKPPKKPLKGHVYISTDGWTEPSPLKWDAEKDPPTTVYDVAWRGRAAVLTSKVQPQK